MENQRDHYGILGVDRDASPEEIKRAYWKLAKKWHPDRCLGCPDAKKRIYDERFREINEAYEALQAPRPGGTNRPPEVTDLDPAKPGPHRAGSWIHWRATAHDPDGDAIYYKFWLKGPSTGNKWKAVREWHASDAWIWATTASDIGKFQVRVQVRDGYHAGPEGWDDYRIADCIVSRQDQLVVTSLTPDPSSPQPSGATVAWTAKTWGSEDTVQYRFWLKGPSTGNAYHAMTPWTGEHRWIWRPERSNAGKNTIKVEVKAGNNSAPDEFDDYEIVSYDIYRSSIFDLKNLKAASYIFLIIALIWSAMSFGVNSPPLVTGLTHRPLGSGVEWTATASDPENDQIYCRFLLNGEVKRDWSTSRTWTWDAGGLPPGDYKVQVWIRDGKHAAEEGWDSQEIAWFQVPKNEKPVVQSLAPDKPSPQVAGGAIRWTASASDAEGDRILYRFLVQGPAEGDTQIARDWSTGRTWTWETAPGGIGDHVIHVHVRDGNHGGKDEWDGHKAESFTLTNPGAKGTRSISNRNTSRLAAIGIKEMRTQFKGANSLTWLQFL